MANLISALNLEKSYGARTLFKDLSFGIGEGERIGLVGPNGAGKSTLLRLLAKKEEADQGEVVWTRGLTVGYLEQTPSFPDLTIEEVLLSEASTNQFDTEWDHFSQPEIQARAEELISRLGLNTQKLNRHSRVLSLSGGQKKKVALARELMKNPSLLILDEPTNHLDIESLLWLEEFLISQPGMTLLLVTHDRLFLQNVVDIIVDLDPRYREGMLRIAGDYSDYLEARALRLEGQQSQESSRANDLRREMAWLRRGAKARQTKQKARQDKVYDLMDEVKNLRSLNRQKALDLSLGAGDSVPKKLIEAQAISKSYGERVLFKDLSLLIQSKSRIALLGKNGSGKTTLIRCLLGEEKIDQGKIKWADKISVNYFEQARDSLKPKESLLQNICPQGDYVHLQGQAVYARSYLDRFRFRREQHDLALERLSGGEQARLLIAQLMLKSAPVLVLDEPTNDLDIETLEILREALANYEGAVLLVTHDRFFMEQVCDTILAFPEPEDLKPGESLGTLIRFESYLQWQQWKEERRRLRKNQIGESKLASNQTFSSSHPTLSEESSRDRKAKMGKLSFKEQRELKDIEPKILEKEAQMQKVQSELDSPEVVSNSAQLLALTTSLQELELEISSLYTRWAELESKLKGS